MVITISRKKKNTFYVWWWCHSVATNLTKLRLAIRLQCVCNIWVSIFELNHWEKKPTSVTLFTLLDVNIKINNLLLESDE